MSIELEPAIPILRIFDVAKAREFYEGFLGFSWDWEHRFDAEAPLFVQVSRGKTLLFLSEHFGDGTPGSHLIIRMSGVDALQVELHARNYRHARPDIQKQPWGYRDLAVSDPFGNRLIFSEECD